VPLLPNRPDGTGYAKTSMDAATSASVSSAAVGVFLD